MASDPILVDGQDDERTPDISSVAVPTPDVPSIAPPVAHEVAVLEVHNNDSVPDQIPLGWDDRWNQVTAAVASVGASVAWSIRIVRLLTVVPTILSLFKPPMSINAITNILSAVIAIGTTAVHLLQSGPFNWTTFATGMIVSVLAYFTGKTGSTSNPTT